MKLLVYVAGPYSHPDPVENTHAACTVGTELFDTGVILPIVPHLSMLFHAIAPRQYEDWLELDLEIVRRCDAVFRMEGESPGADREVAYAKKHRIPVFETRYELIAHQRMMSEPL